MRVTSKGQVAMPRSVRRHLGVEPGSEVDFEIEGDSVRLVRQDDGLGAAVVAEMRGRRVRMTTEQIMALTRGES